MNVDQAFLTNITGIQNTLYAYVCSLLGGSAHARDVLQETNLALWEKAAQFDSTRPFAPWAFQFAYNQVLAFRKKQRAERLVFDDSLLEAVHERTGSHMIEIEQRYQTLDECVEKLPDRHRELIKQRYQHGLDIVEIARITNSSANGLATMLFRARKAIFDCVKLSLAAENRS